MQKWRRPWGGVTALAGVIPGVGTAISMVGGGLADVSFSMKFQIDMTMCLAMALKDDLANEDAKHMSFIIALCGSLEKAGVAEGGRVASEAGVKMVDRYLKGATLMFIKELFSKVGLTFTKSATIKAIPFGVGVVLGGSAGYAMSQYVGKYARDFFCWTTTWIDATMPALENEEKRLHAMVKRPANKMVSVCRKS